MTVNARPLKFIADACAGTIRPGAGSGVVRGVSTDSRKIQSGELFVALAGDRFDGHRFLADVARGGAAAVLVNRGADVSGVSCAVVEVENTRTALGQLATAHRCGFSLPVVAVGGSNGKTTTKELVAAVLRQRLNTLKSEASFNNDIGVPLTLLQIEPAHEVAVLEVGTNHPGELAPLVRMVQPGHGIITNIGREHLEFFGDLAGVVQEEGALAELLPAEGVLYVNEDDPFTPQLARRTRARIVRVGSGVGCDWQASSVRLHKEGVDFHVRAARPDYSGEYHVNLLGRHQVVNALLAMAVGAELGVDADAIRRGLAECPPSSMRMQLYELNGVRVLDDAYNANADSVIAALRTLTELPCKGRTVAVLGDMAELGQHTESAHREVGRFAAELGVGQLFAVGRMAAVMAQAAREGGLTRVLEFAEVEAAAGAVKNFVRPGDLLLLKASRVARLERIAETLRGLEAALRN